MGIGKQPLQKQTYSRITFIAKRYTSDNIKDMNILTNKTADLGLPGSTEKLRKNMKCVITVGVSNVIHKDYCICV
jgi:hypothetical protein